MLILGELFMRHYFTVFQREGDEGDARVGIARASHSANVTDFFAEADALVYIHTLSRTVVRPTDRRVAAIIAKNLRLPSRLAVQQLVLVNSPAPFLGRAQSQQRCAFLPRSKLGRNTVAALLKPPRETKLEKERNRVIREQEAAGCC